MYEFTNKRSNIKGYRYHQNGRPDIFANISDEELKEDLIQNFDRLTTIVILDNENIVGYLSYKLKNIILAN